MAKSAPEPNGPDPKAPVQYVGRYELIEKIATGGMAELFVARFHGPGGFEKRCALKRILPQFAQDDNFRKMFMNEARVAALFEHPNLAHVIELSEDESTGQFYIAMELVEGMDLKDLEYLLKTREAQMPPAIAAFIMAQVLDGLAYAHEFRDADGLPLHLVHRDVSPQNLLLSFDGSVKVVDFGIVKATITEGKTQTGYLKGKLAYMSPEQLLGETLDARSDIFAAGICLYELLAGERPFFANNEVMIAKAILEREPESIRSRRPDCPRELEAILQKALKKAPEDRFQTAQEFSTRLNAVLRHTPEPMSRHLLASYIQHHAGAEKQPFDTRAITLPPDEPKLQKTLNAVRKRLTSQATETGPRQAELMTEAQTLSGTDPMLIDPQAEILGQRRSRPALAVLLAGLIILLIGTVVWFTAPPPSGPPAVHEASPQAGVVVPQAPEVVISQSSAPPPDADDRGPASGDANSKSPTPALDEASAPIQEPERGAPSSAPQTKQELAPEPEQTAPAPKRAAIRGATEARRVTVRRKTKQTGSLSLSSVPRGLSIRLDGHLLGKTPITGLTLPAGRHTLVLVHPRHRIKKKVSIRLRAGASVKRKVIVGRSTIKVLSNQTGRVFVDGREVGETPYQGPLYEGRHRIKVMLPDGRKKSRNVDAVENHNAEPIEFTF